MLISIGLPVYNAEETVGLAVFSILAQTYTDFELIVVDDASEDRSLAMIELFRDRRIKLVKEGVHRGLSYRLNQIAEMARGCYLARMDADDVMHPDRIARQVRFLENHGEIDVIGTDAYAIDRRNRVIGYLSSPDDFSARRVLTRGCFIHPTVMGRRRWFLQNPYDLGYSRAEDHELWCRTCGSSKFYNLHDALLFYRTGDAARLTKQLVSQATRAEIIGRLGPKVAGPTLTKLALAALLLRTGAYVTVRACGLMPMVNWLKRRKAWLSRADRLRLAEAEGVLAALVRGWLDGGGAILGAATTDVATGC